MAEWKTDPRTAQHLERTKRYALAVTRNIDPHLAEEPWLKIGFLLHDIGKAGVEESILMKPGPLSPKELELVRLHPIIGAQWLEPIEFLAEAIPIVKQHHERWDGDGYPYGLAGEDIHLGARIFTVVDAFDAMTSDRPYRSALSLDQALEEIKKGGGTQFDPEVVRVLCAMWPDLSEMHGAVHA
jgi:HD-GYP domain-containing protein (c-di-GMP phosphodiesterase class II)